MDQPEIMTVTFTHNSALRYPAPNAEALMKNYSRKKPTSLDVVSRLQLSDYYAEASAVDNEAAVLEAVKQARARTLLCAGREAWLQAREHAPFDLGISIPGTTAVVYSTTTQSRAMAECIEGVTRNLRDASRALNRAHDQLVAAVAGDRAKKFADLPAAKRTFGKACEMFPEVPREVLAYGF